MYHLLSAMLVSKKFTRDEFIKILFEKYKIKCVIQYYPLYRYNLFKKMRLSKNNCPNTDQFYDNMVSFPFHIWMSDKDFNRMISCVKKTIIDLRNK